MEENMRKTLLTSVAAVALVAGTTFGFAQGMGKNGAGESPAAAPSAGSSGGASAPSSASPGEKSGSMTRGQGGADHQAPGAGMKGGQAEQKSPRANDSAQRDRDMKTKGAESEGKSGGKAASETTRDKSKSDMKADSKKSGDRDRNAAETKSDTKAGATTGQAGAGAKLTSEQRTKITTVIHKQNLKPVTNVNFSISVGTRVPRTVAFHPVPTEIVTIYPAWRGYEFFLVADEIVIVDPQTLEIVAVLPA
jgi:hypothetical protein